MRLIAARLAERLREERGISLVMALGIMLVLALSTAATIDYTRAGSRTSSLSRAGTVAQALAEAGINDAQARLNDSASNPLASTLLTPASGGVTCPDGVNTCFETAYQGGTALWFGTLAGTTWTITSWGRTANPTATGTIERRLRVSTEILADAMQPNSVPAWDYVYSSRTSDSDTCDVTINNNAFVDVDFYVQGNLCIDNNAHVIQPDDTMPVELIVHGKLSIRNNGNVGESGNPIAKAKVGGGCTNRIDRATHVCTTADDFYVDEYTQVPTNVVPPTADYAGWYDNARPGPRFPCNQTAGPAAWPTWDVDTNLDLTTTGNAGTFDLTPSEDYTCRYVQNGATVGELSWVASTRTLKVRGVMYFDGSLTASGVNVYDGAATIYLTGKLTLTNNTYICAVKLVAECDWSAWNPASKMLVFVANGGNLATSVEVSNNSGYQGGLMGKKEIDVSNNAIVQGPMIAEQAIGANNSTLKPLPAITDVPFGTPGVPATRYTPTPPRYTS